MLIDWFTVAAQIINFLVLVWMLKRFLYGRILRAMEARDNRIAAQVAEAEAKQKAATEQLALYQNRLQEFETLRESLLAEARGKAEKRYSELLEEARAHVHGLETDWQKDLDRERDAFLRDLRQRAAAEILALARQAVADLACVDVQRCAVQVFLEKLRRLDREAWKNLAKGELAIRTAFDLPESTRDEIERTIQQGTETPVRFHFELAPGIGLGIELRGNGWRIGWNSESYLESLEEDLRQAFQQSAAGPEEHRLAATAHSGAR